VGQDFDNMAWDAPDSGRSSTSGARHGSPLLRDKSRRTSGARNRGARSARRTFASDQEGSNLKMHDKWKIVLLKVHAKRVPLPVFLGYWGIWAIVVGTVGAIWGF
jgi:hypothetical protein